MADAIELGDSDEEDAAPPAVTVIDEPAPTGLRRSLRSTAYQSLAQQLQGISGVYTAPSGNVELGPNDLTTVAPGEFLNDNVIEYYLKFLQAQAVENDQDLESCHFFNSFFYYKLTQKADKAEGEDKENKRGHERVKKWTKAVDIFSKRYVFVPIHAALHWSLAIIVNPGNVGQGSEMCEPIIVHLDSMRGHHPTSQVSKQLQNYICHEWTHRQKMRGEEPTEYPKKEELRCRSLKVPEQKNGCDCGVFVLAFVKHFLSNLPEVLTDDHIEQLTQRHPTGIGMGTSTCFLGPAWFDSDDASAMRTQIKYHLLKLLVDTSGVSKDDTRIQVAKAEIEMVERELEREERERKQRIQRAADRKRREKERREREEQEKAAKAARVAAAREASTSGAGPAPSAVCLPEEETLIGSRPAAASYRIPRNVVGDDDDEQEMPRDASVRNRRVCDSPMSTDLNAHADIDDVSLPDAVNNEPMQAAGDLVDPGEGTYPTRAPPGKLDRTRKYLEGMGASTHVEEVVLTEPDDPENPPWLNEQLRTQQQQQQQAPAVAPPSGDSDDEDADTIRMVEHGKDGYP